MGLLKRKVDPVSDRARSLNERIAALEKEIKTLDAQVQRGPAGPRVRSTTTPGGETVPHAHATPGMAPHEPVFEAVDQAGLKNNSEPAVAPEHFNELGVRKFDLPGVLRRLKQFFGGPTTRNPRLVSYLAAGGIQGLRPMRYEKRVARRRFIVLSVILLLTLFGLIWMIVKPR